MSDIEKSSKSAVPPIDNSESPVFRYIFDGVAPDQPPVDSPSDSTDTPATSSNATVSSPDLAQSASWRENAGKVFNRSVSDARIAAQSDDVSVRVALEESKLTVKIIAIGVLLVFVLACIGWFWPHAKQTTQTDNLNLAPQQNLKVVPDPDPTLAPIAAVASISGKNDGWDNASLAPLAIDGKPETSWNTATMRTSKLVDGRGFGLALNLGETPIMVRKVVVFSSTKGGKLELRQTTADNPSGGNELGVQEMADSVTFDLAAPVETNQLVLWSTEMPTAPGGGYRLIISEVQVFS